MRKVPSTLARSASLRMNVVSHAHQDRLQGVDDDGFACAVSPVNVISPVQIRSPVNNRKIFDVQID
jgi:hypothetical protein